MGVDLHHRPAAFRRAKLPALAADWPIGQGIQEGQRDDDDDKPTADTKKTEASKTTSTRAPT